MVALSNRPDGGLKTGVFKFSLRADPARAQFINAGEKGNNHGSIRQPFDNPVSVGGINDNFENTQLRRSAFEKNMYGKTLVEMDRHELAAAAGKAIDSLEVAKEKLQTAFNNLPTPATTAEGDHRTAAFETLSAIAEFAVITRAELVLVIAETNY